MNRGDRTRSIQAMEYALLALIREAERFKAQVDGGNTMTARSDLVQAARRYGRAVDNLARRT